ncbi:MAG: ATP-binding protein [Desulfobacterales bacterium]
MLAAVFAASPVEAGAPVDIRHVLVLYPQDGLAVPAYQEIYRGLKAVFASETEKSVNLLNENLDLSIFDEEAEQHSLVEFLRIKYAAEHIDAIVPVTFPALSFVLRQGETAFPGVPIVFCAITDEDLSTVGRLPNGTGVAVTIDIAGTIEAAQKLQPGLRRLAVVAGTGPTDRYLVPVAHRVHGEISPALEWIDLTGLPMAELLNRVSRLPPATAILFLTVQRDGAGNRFVSAEAQQMVSMAANAPLYNFIDAAFGYGSVGGCMTALEANGRQAAEMILRVFSGEKAGAIEPVVVRRNPRLFDWREMQRWGIAENALPPESVVRYKQFSFWETHKWRIAGVLAFLVFQSVLIVGLAINLSKRKKAEAFLARSEANLKGTQDIARVGGFIFDIPGDRLLWAEGTTRIFGLEPHFKISYDVFLRLIYPADREYMDRAWQAALKGRPCDIEYRILVDDRLRWMRAKVSVEFDRRNRPLLAKGIVQDISDLKESEADAARLRRDLAHVARVSTMGELSQNLAHEVNQPLAAIGANAEAALRLLAEPEPDLAEVRDALGDIVSDQKRAHTVIQRIRTLVKKDRPVPVRVDLNEVARAAAQMVDGDAAARKASIQLELDSGLPRVWGDKVELQQVVINLLVNALDALDQDGSARRLVTVKTGGGPAGGVTIAVADTGAGVDPEIAERLFNPFVTTKPGGLGLGLSLSRSILEACGGSIHAAANSDGGATFIVGLPAVSRECEQGQPAACPRTGL